MAVLVLDCILRNGLSSLDSWSNVDSAITLLFEYEYRCTEYEYDFLTNAIFIGERRDYPFIPPTHRRRTAYQLPKQ